jgi:aminoglycoside 6'-N-acetyltransferase I
MSADHATFSFHEVTLETVGTHRVEWVRLRRALWHDSLESLDAQLHQLRRAGVPYVGFLACHLDGEAVGFAEASLRPYVNGCETSPVAFLEGLFVDPSVRRRGIARELVAMAEAWGKSAGCSEFASDILADNHASHAAHLALGFIETEHVIYFRKSLQ